MSNPSHERKYELVVNATESELSPEVIRELCFDPESGAWLLGLLDRGLVPPWVVDEHLSMDDPEGTFVQHRVQLVRAAELSDEQWEILARDEWIDVQEAMVVEGESRDIPDAALREAWRQVEEFMKEEGFPEPQWHWSFVGPIVNEWVSLPNQTRIALVNSISQGYICQTIDTGSTDEVKRDLVLDAVAALAQGQFLIADGVLWWHSHWQKVERVGGYLVTAERSACRFVVTRHSGGLEWKVDDRLQTWGVDDLDTCNRVWEAARLGDV